MPASSKELAELAQISKLFKKVRQEMRDNPIRLLDEDKEKSQPPLHLLPRKDLVFGDMSRRNSFS